MERHGEKKWKKEAKKKKLPIVKKIKWDNHSDR